MRRSVDFTELYRAAFAEVDPEKKLSLLREVQKVIDGSELELENVSPGETHFVQFDS
jgi:hypothetical protein